MNPRSSFGQTPPDLLHVSTVPWWEAVPWTSGRATFAHVRQVGALVRLCDALAIECVVMLAFAIAGLVLGWGR